MEGSV